jgi:HEAT repeat protein
MAGHTRVRWDERAGRLVYESMDRSRRPSSEQWDRQPSPEEWARFWTAMDSIGVWGWKRDYGEVTEYTDCTGWYVRLRHGGKVMSSVGCGHDPEAGGLDRLIAELARLRGDASASDGLALDLARHLQQSTDWDDRIQTVRKLGSMRPVPIAAVPALVELLGAPPSSRHLAAPGSEPVAVARAVQPLMNLGDGMLEHGIWDKAIAFYDQVLARDPQSELAAGRRARAIESRDLRRQQAAQGGRGPSPSFVAAYETRRNEAVLTAAAEDALVAIGEPAVPPLIEALKDKNRNRACRAAKVLAQIPAAASTSAPALARVLRDPAVRNAAARALMRIAPQDSERYLPVLISGVDDPDADVARVSAAALAEIGTPAVLPALMHALADNRTHGIAMTGLGRMGPLAVAAVPAFLESLRLDMPASESATAEQALKAMGAATVVPVVVDVLRNDKEGWKRDLAVQALARLGPAASGAVPALIETFRYGGSLAGNAAEAVRQIGAPAVPALTAALTCDRLPPAPPMSQTWYRETAYHETEYVRIYAAYALSLVGGHAKAAIPALREALSDASPKVREAAAGALRVLERP